MVVAIVFGIVVDDPIHFLSNYLEGRRKGLAAADAVRTAFKTVGDALLTTSVVLAAGFLVFATSGFEVSWTLGLLVTTTTVLALAADFLLLPALLLAINKERSMTGLGGDADTLQVILAQPRGFCAGVERAIETVEAALRKYGAPVYVRHEIVHNPRVVENLKAKGVRFVERIEEIPTGMVAVFSAHGVSAQVEAEAEDRGLRSIDATCPLVSKVHVEGRRYAANGYNIVLIGHENHPEVEGTVTTVRRGQIPAHVSVVGNVEGVSALTIRDPEKVAYITQTTLSIDDTREVIAALRRRFPKIVGPDVKDICYATQNRQATVRKAAAIVDLILVVGARNSSNSNRLCEVGRDAGVPTYLVDGPGELNPSWLRGKRSVCITAGASNPEELVQEVVEELRRHATLRVSTMDGIVEKVRFGLPDELESEMSGQGGET